jgi:Bacterial Ig-like domain
MVRANPLSRRAVRPTQPRRARLLLEVLEDRVVPANVLMLVDANGPGTDALKAALVAAGNAVTTTSPEYAWDGTNPSPAGFQVVIHLDGSTYFAPLPVSAQQTLENFVQQGGGFIAGQWNGYELVQGQQVSMPDLVLQRWGESGADGGGSINVTYTTVSGQENHPVLAGIPTSFTFFADGHDASSLVNFATQPSTALMTATSGGPGVIVRDFGAGHVANFSFAPNYTTQITLQDPNIQKLYVNAVNWASGLAVTSSVPANGATVATPLQDFVINFSQPYDPATVDPGDLTVNGKAANSVTQTDADTLTFHFNVSPMTSQGLQTMHMNAGSVAPLNSGAGLLPEFNASFRYDAVLMQVTSTVPAGGSLVTLPFSTLDLNFNEPYKLASADPSDFTLSQARSEDHRGR